MRQQPSIGNAEQQLESSTSEASVDKIWQWRAAVAEGGEGTLARRQVRDGIGRSPGNMRANQRSARKQRGRESEKWAESTVDTI